MGLASTGKGEDLVGCHHRLIGDKGVIKVYPSDLRLREMGDKEWEGVEFNAGNQIELAIEDVVEALEKGEKSELCAENALKATEAIFACYESVRRRGRVETPLMIEDNPLESMVESAELGFSLNGESEDTENE